MTDAERLAALEDAYFSGQKRAKLDGQEYEYQSMSEMWAAIVRLRNKIAPASRPPVMSARPTCWNRGRR